MVYIWGALTGLVALALVQWWRGRLFQRRWLLVAFVVAVLGPFVANEAGWVASEVGRQPWVVQGLLRTSEAHSQTLPPGQVAGVIVLFGLVYVLLFMVWLRLLNRLIQRGPEAETAPAPAAGAPPLLDVASRRTTGARVDTEAVELR
jgi:cytochrome d ubiquinol oxidase subunit I